MASNACIASGNNIAGLFILACISVFLQRFDQVRHYYDEWRPVNVTASKSSSNDGTKPRYSKLMDFREFDISPEVEEAFGTNKDFSVLLRPDIHAGWISSDSSFSRGRDYLVKFIGRVTTP